jgi:hypothetical protein
MPDNHILQNFLFYVIVFGGFLSSLVTAISYFSSGRLGRNTKIVLEGACLIPLVSLALLLGGLFVSGSQWLATLPCIVSMLVFCPALTMGTPAAFLRSPVRGTVGLLSILWSAAMAFTASHSCFMSACC